MTNQNHERREHPRYRAAADVEIRIEAAPSVPGLMGRIINCNTSDISLRGACLVMDEAIPRDTELVLLIKLRGLPQRFRHRGRVVWCRESREKETDEAAYQTGIEFQVSADMPFTEWRTELLRLYEGA